MTATTPARPPDPPQHAAARGDDGGLLRRPPARRRGLVAHLRARHRRRGAARARAGDLPHRVGARRRARGAADGPDRAQAGDRRRLRGRGGGLRLTALATNVGSAPLVILGFALTGAASGIALLIRTAAGDLYPPEHRARGISYVLFGSVFGAILGPAVFGPLFAGRELDAAALTVPWLAAAGSACWRWARAADPPGPEADRRAHRRPRRRCARAAGRAARRDPAAPGRPAGDARRARLVRRDGLGDEPERLRRSSSTTITSRATCSRSSARTCSACTRSCSWSAR